MTLTEAQYQALLTLYHEMIIAFSHLPEEVKEAFYNRLYQK